MATTYELIASYTASSSISPIEFTSIPQTFTDLVLKFTPRNDGQVWGTVNINAGGAYRQINWGMYNGSVSRGSGTDNAYTVWSPNGSSQANTFGTTEIYIPNYSGSNYKVINIDTNANNSINTSFVYMSMIAFLFESQAAVTSIALTSHNSPGNKWIANTSAELYGIKNS
jgi:hypothetical protein